MLREDRMHRLPQLADPFAVNDSHLQNAARPAFGEVIGHDALDIRRMERVQIEDAVDGKFDRPHSVLVDVVAVARCHFGKPPASLEDSSSSTVPGMVPYASGSFAAFPLTLTLS